MRNTLAFVVLLALAGCAADDSVAEKPQDPRGERIIGEWVGGGGLMPVSHAFAVDGTYERRYIPVKDEPPVRTAGTWDLRGDQLVRRIDGRDHLVTILHFEEDFFQVVDSHGNRHGYHRRATTTQ